MRGGGGREQVLANLTRNGLDALVAIGGDDTLSVAAWLAAQGGHVVGVPKTMDNDLSVTEYCIGFDSAVSIVAESLDRLHTTGCLAPPRDGCRGHGTRHRVGRRDGWPCGWRGHDHHPQFPVTLSEVVAHLEARRSMGSDFSIIVISEGVEMKGLSPEEDADEGRDAFGHARLSKRGVGERLTELIETKTGLETRTTVLGYVQRGGAPSAYDRILGDPRRRRRVRTL